MVTDSEVNKNDVSTITDLSRSADLAWQFPSRKQASPGLITDSRLP